MIEIEPFLDSLGQNMKTLNVGMIGYKFMGKTH
jgi:hypothetical protein